MAAEGEDADKVNTVYKHSFAYCELDGYFYCRRKDASNFFLKIDADTGNAWGWTRATTTFWGRPTAI